VKACPICQSTYDDSVDFCFKDGAPLEAADDETESTAATETLSAILSDDLEPPDAISLSNIPSIDQTLPAAADEDLLPPEPTFSNLKPVKVDDDEDDESAATQVVDPTDLPEPDSDPTDLPEPDSEPPTSPKDEGEPQTSATVGEADAAAPTADLDEDKGSKKVAKGVSVKAGPKGRGAKSGKGGKGAEGKKAAAAGKAGKARPRVEVTEAKPKRSPRPTTTPLGDAGVISARREAEKGNNGLLIGLGIAALLLVGFIVMTLSGGGDEPEPEAATASASDRGSELPPLEPARSSGAQSEPAGEGAEGDAPAEGEGAGADEGDEAADGESDGEAEGEGDADAPGEADANGGESDEGDATAEAAPADEPEPEPEPEPKPESTPAPTPEPEPTPSGAPEPPIAVRTEPTPAPAPEPTPAASSNPWTAPAEPTPAPSVVDPANPWGTPAEATTGTLIVSSNPGGATVLVDGASRGTTPLSLQLPFKDYEVRVSKDGFASRTQVVRVVGTKPISVDVALESLAPAAATQAMAVIIASNPGGAIIFVDGARKGPTPLTVPMTVGNHEIRLEAPGLPACTRTLGVTDKTRNAFYDLNTCN